MCNRMSIAPMVLLAGKVPYLFDKRVWVLWVSEVRHGCSLDLVWVSASLYGCFNTHSWIQFSTYLCPVMVRIVLLYFWYCIDRTPKRSTKIRIKGGHATTKQRNTFLYNKIWLTVAARIRTLSAWGQLAGCLILILKQGFRYEAKLRYATKFGAELLTSILVPSTTELRAWEARLYSLFSFLFIICIYIYSIFYSLLFYSLFYTRTPCFATFAGAGGVVCDPPAFPNGTSKSFAEKKTVDCPRRVLAIGGISFGPRSIFDPVMTGQRSNFRKFHDF